MNGVPTILCEGFDNCPHCGADPPPGTTAESREHHIRLCASGAIDRTQPRLSKLERAALAGDTDGVPGEQP